MGAAPEQTFIGKTVGNYVVEDRLGEGGMGAVYLARHPLIGKKVALKVLHPEFVSDPEVVSRFFTEAKAVNDIQHPNIVDIIDYGALAQDDGTQAVYFMMEFLDGEMVTSLIEREAPLPPARALPIAAQIADALAASHQHGIIHRDLKPDNIFLIERGRQRDVVKVLDFGIAKLTGDHPGSRRTRTGVVIGTPYYMAPEQCEGRGNIDHRADVYALGCVLYEMLTGRVPFDGEGYGEILVQHLTQLPPTPRSIAPAIPEEVEAVCLKALEKNRDHRYATMEDFASALASPAEYVAACGGLDRFLSAGRVMGLPALPGAARAPVAIAPEHTPPPGLVSGAARAGAATAPPVAATADDDRDLDRPPRSRAPLVAVAAVAALGGVAAALALGGGGGDGGGEPAPAVEPAAAAAAAAAPAAPVAPAPEPSRITITIESSPAGAGVFVGGGDEPVGTTPYDLEVERGAEPLAIAVRKPGFEEERREIVPERSVVLSLELAAVPAAEPEPKKKRDRRSTRPKPRPDTRKKRKKLGDDIMAPDL